MTASNLAFWQQGAKQLKDHLANRHWLPVARFCIRGEQFTQRSLAGCFQDPLRAIVLLKVWLPSQALRERASAGRQAAGSWPPGIAEASVAAHRFLAIAVRSQCALPTRLELFPGFLFFNSSPNERVEMPQRAAICFPENVPV